MTGILMRGANLGKEWTQLGSEDKDQNEVSANLARPRLAATTMTISHRHLGPISVKAYRRTSSSLQQQKHCSHHLDYGDSVTTALECKHVYQQLSVWLLGDCITHVSNGGNDVHQTSLLFSQPVWYVLPISLPLFSVLHHQLLPVRK